MAEKKNDTEKACCNGHHTNPQNGAVYGLGMIGAAVYFISNATSFWMGVLGFLKALVWPAIFVYESLKFFLR